MMPDWRKTREEIIRLLQENEGRMLRSDLVAGVDAPESQIANVLRFMGCLSISEGMYKPSTVYLPDSPHITPEMWPPVEVWLRKVFAKRKRVLSSQLAEASEKRGFSKSAYDQACIRIGLVSEKITEGPHAGHWAKVKK